MITFVDRQRRPLLVLALALGLVVSLPQVVQAHAGHDHEFVGGNAEQIMQPLTIEPAAAQALGLKTATIAAGDPIKVPSMSIVEANGNQLVYQQLNGTYKPVPVKLGKTAGDWVELAEGNLQAGDQVVSQGAPLLYSEALRRKPETAPHEHGPHTHTHDDAGGISKKKLALGILAGGLVGGGIMFGLSKRQKQSTKE